MPEPGRYACHNASLPPFPLEADACWERAPGGELLETVSGKRPFLATEFRLLRDDAQQAFFLRFLAEDDEVHSIYRLDEECLYRQDVLEIFVAENDNLTHYKEIEVTPYDLRFTGAIENAGAGLKINLDWDIPGFRTRTRFYREENRLASVWRIPYAAFDRPPAPGTSWRFNVYRIDHSRRGIELMAWQATGEPNFHVPARFAFLDFMA